MNIGIAIHGGAGTILKEDLTNDLEIKYKNSLKDALLKGEKYYKKVAAQLRLFLVQLSSSKIILFLMLVKGLFLIILANTKWMHL